MSLLPPILRRVSALVLALSVAGLYGQDTPVATAPTSDTPPTAAAPAATSSYTPSSSEVVYPLTADRPPLTPERLPHRPPLRPIFFPPNPPPLGEFLPPVFESSGSIEAPAELEEHINEIFYAPLSTHLAGNSLSRRSATRLAAYRATKLALQNELLAKLDEVRPLPAKARHATLVAFAREQTPKIVELEKSADRLREELIAARAGADWNDLRSWNLGDSNERKMPLTAVRDVIRAAVFYQKGLSLDQRRLLREVAIELEHPTTEFDAGAYETSFLFFSPETARIAVPDNITPALGAKIADYETRKSGLRKELFDTIVAHDNVYFSFSRSAALRALAEKQAPQIAELEPLAEEIRMELAQLDAGAAPPDLPRLPSHLSRRMSAYTEKRQTLNRLGLDVVQQVKQLAPNTSITPIRTSAGYTLKVTIRDGRLTPTTVERLEAIVHRFNREYARGSEELAAEKEILRDELSRVFAVETAGGGKTVDGLINEFTESMKQHEQWMIDREYRTAVLEPGLSLEQRRLLFDAALVRYELPLPRGELQPN